MNTENTMLLRDALERVVANPTASERWHRLLAHYEATPDAQARHAVAQSLLENVPAEGIGGFFRATFLAGVLDEAGGSADGEVIDAHIADAGRILQDITPVDPERLMAFAAFEWGRALAGEGDRRKFIVRLRNALLPEVIDLCAMHLNRGAGLSVRAVERVQRVALVTPFIGVEGHTPTALTLRHARILRELGIEVAVFSGQEFLMPDMQEYLGNRGRVTIAAPDMKQLAGLVPSGVRVTLGDPRYSMMRRWQRMLAEVTAFDPDLVFFIGLYSPLLKPLYAARPVLGLSVHAIAPMAQVDVWLTATPSLAGQWSAPWGPKVPPAWGHYHPYRIALKPAGEAISRSSWAIPEESVVLVTVGARLVHEIGGEWAARMARSLDRFAGVVWVLVGGDGVLPPALRELPSDRVRVLGHSENLRGILRCCDIYINPPRLGGGFSVAEAMAEGLPVVTFADSDGGNKVGGSAVGSMDAYFDRLETLLDQPVLREQDGAAMKNLFSDTLDLFRSGPSLWEACEQTVRLFRERTKLAAATA